MQISTVMTRSSSLAPTTCVADALQRMAREGVTALPVVDDAGRLMGVVSQGALLGAAMPDLTELLACGGSMRDAEGHFEHSAARMGRRAVARYLDEAPLTLSAEDSVFTAAVALQGEAQGAPVLRGERVVGWVGQAELCAALMQPMRLREAA